MTAHTQQVPTTSAEYALVLVLSPVGPTVHSPLFHSSFVPESYIRQSSGTSRWWWTQCFNPFVRVYADLNTPNLENSVYAQFQIQRHSPPQMIRVNEYGSETKIINDSHRSLDPHNITLYSEWPCDGGGMLKKNMKLTYLSPLFVLSPYRWL